jgi:hypothetical protein
LRQTTGAPRPETEGLAEGGDTNDGFVGHGTDNFVDNGQVVVSRITDIMTNASGDRFRARGVFVLDVSTETVRVERFELTCLGP